MVAKYAKVGGMVLVPMKRPPGRPKTPASKRLGVRVFVSLSEVEARALAAFGKRHKRSRASAAGREAILSALRGESLL